MASSATSKKDGEELVWLCRACAQQRRKTRWSDQGIATIHGSKCQRQPAPGSSQTSQNKAPQQVPPKRGSGGHWGQASLWLHMGEPGLLPGTGVQAQSRWGFGEGMAQAVNPQSPSASWQQGGRLQGLCNTHSRGLISINKANRLKPWPLLTLPPSPHLP